MLAYKFSKVSDFTHFDIINGNLPGLLHYEDKIVWLIQLTRVPFLDHRLVNFLFQSQLFKK